MTTVGTPTSTSGADPPPLVPARILNEHVYCPRLAWLEWEAQAFTDNLETVEGRDHHRAVDRPRGKMPAPRSLGGAGAGAASPAVPVDREVEGFGSVTSLRLSSERLGVLAVVDRVDADGDAVIPIEVKRGAPVDGPFAPLREPEFAQLTAQSLLLREAGYEVLEASVFFAATRTRHSVKLPEDAERWIIRLADEIRRNAGSPTPPPPLVDSPKCPRCSLVSVCLPDETNLLQSKRSRLPRRLVAGASPATPLYLTTPGSRLRKDGGRLVLEVDGERVDSRRLLEVSQLVVVGNATASSAVLRACMDDDIPVVWFTYGGWYAGHAIAHGGSWVQRRLAQTRIVHDGSTLRFGRAFVNGKIRNQRTMLRRLGPAELAPTLERLATLANQASVAEQLESLFGYEGAAARTYFAGFPALLRRHADDFSFEGRNRRPPLDPVNAVLSFAYGLLVRDATVALLSAGLDPQVGFMHRPQFGRPSLALDLAEEFRPLVGDSTTLLAFNNGELQPTAFVERGGAVGLTASGRKALIGTYERRVAQEITHPLFGYKVSYRRAIELQARLLAAVVDGQFDDYQPFITR